MDQKKQTKIISFLKRRETRKKRKKNCQKSNYYCDFFCIHPAPDDSVQKDLKFDKKCKRNCDNPKKQNKHRKSECPHAPVTSLSSGSSKGMWTLWYQKKINLLNTSASARSSLRAKKRGRAACVYPAKFSKKHCDCDISQFAKQVWSPPTYCTTQYPPKNHTLCLQLPSC